MKNFLRNVVQLNLEQFNKLLIASALTQMQKIVENADANF